MWGKLSVGGKQKEGASVTEGVSVLLRTTENQTRGNKKQTSVTKLSSSGKPLSHAIIYIIFWNMCFLHYATMGK